MARTRTLPVGSSNSGFTLLELLVALTLLAIAATLIAPRLAGSTASARLRGAAVTLEQALRQARFEARTTHAARWLMLEPQRFAIGRGQAAVNWRPIGNVEIVGARVGGARVGAIRLAPSGASAPWAIELRTEGQTRVLWNDGVTAELRVAAARSLDEWSGPVLRSVP
ncbi:MAG: prepilin-type N-terminal cleavage/methylation domain-containing protein [Phycisphaerales bacterium]|nr:prepilin-type N-terminal cleavage/methylation domain-containing protein [Phycisphaerales bacterium]